MSGGIDIKDSTFEDAVSAVNLGPEIDLTCSGTYNIRRSTFRNNHIGILMDDKNNIPAYHCPEANDAIIGNTFVYTDSLLPSPVATGGKLPISHVARVGILIYNRINPVLIGSPNNPQFPGVENLNRFDSLHNGILAFDTALEVYGAQFEDMIHEFSITPPTPDHPGVYRGYGICHIRRNSSTNPASSNLLVRGLGDVEPTFKRCQLSILGKRLHDMEVSDCLMESVERGVRAMDIKNTIRIVDHEIECEYYGINLINNVNLQSALVEHNDIVVRDLPTYVVDETDAGTYAGRGIWVENADDNTGESIIDILNNYVTLYEAIRGIDLQNTSAVFVRSNDIKMELPIPLNPNDLELANGQGIRLVNSTNCEVECNRIDGTRVGPFNVGISLNKTTHTILSCNTMDSTRVGLRVFDECGNSTIQGNTFRGHHIGLLYAVNNSNVFPNTGQQTNAGNRWVGTYSTRAAWYQGTDAQAFANRYFVEPNDIGTILWPATHDPVGWFLPSDPDAPETFSCFEEGGEFPPPTICDDATQTLSSGTTALDFRIAEGEMLESIHPTQAWTMKRNLYRKLKENSSLTNAPQLNAFVGQEANTTIGKFYKVQKDIKQLHSHPGSYQSKLQKASQLRSKNSNINVNIQPEINEQIVNEIYLATLAIDNEELTAQQEAGLLEIAYQCADLGGPAVLRARSILTILKDMFFKDVMDCPTQAFRKNETNSNEYDALLIYPNPAINYIELIYPKKEVEQSLIIYDMLGNQVVQQYLSPNSERQSLSVEQLTNGIYQCVILIEGKLISTKKIVIMQ